MNNINFNYTYSYTEVLQAITDLKTNGLFEGYTLNIPELDKRIRLDKGKLCTITGKPSCGKSEFTDFICVQLNKLYNFRTLFFSAEDTLNMHLSKLIDKYNFDDSITAENQARFLTDNFSFIDYDKVYTVDKLFEVAENEMNNKKFDIIVVDPFNKLEANKDYSINMTDYISKFLDRLIRFTKKYKVITLLVAHPRKIYDSNNDYIPNAYDISDSAHFFNKSDYCFTVHGIKDTFTTTIKIDKVKYKHLGIGGKVVLDYDDKTGNFYYSENDTASIYDEDIKPYKIDKYIPSEVNQNIIDYLDIEVDWFNNIEDNKPKARNLKKLLTGNSRINDLQVIENLRKLQYGTDDYKRLKKQLSNFSINAKFDGTRAKANVKEVTGLCYLDIDYKDNIDIINDVPQILKSINNIVFFKKSCSGMGYFAIVVYNKQLPFENVWNALNDDFSNLGITIDTNTKNIDRVTFYSSDEDYYINDNVEVYNKTLEIVQPHHQIKQITKTQKKSTKNGNTKYIKDLITWCNNNNKCLDKGNYGNWEKICLGLISEFSDDGLDYFIQLSQSYDYFDEIEATEFYNNHLDKYEHSNDVTFATIKHYANEIGFNG